MGTTAICSLRHPAIMTNSVLEHASNDVLPPEQVTHDVLPSEDAMDAEGTSDLTGMFSPEPTCNDVLPSEDAIDVERTDDLMGILQPEFTIIDVLPLKSIPTSTSSLQTSTSMPQLSTATSSPQPNSSSRKADLDLLVNKTISLLTGRRIVDVGHFIGEIFKLVNHDRILSCPVNAINFVSEERIGLKSKFKYHCDMCNKNFVLTSEPFSTEEYTNANFAGVMGIVSIGGGYSQLEEFTASLNIPCMAYMTYLKYHMKVDEAWHLTALAEMEKAAKEEFLLAVQNNDVDKEGCPCITVVVDGAWSKRSYRGTKYDSLSGVVS